MNFLILNKAKKMLLIFGKIKIRKWFSNSEETYEELANKTDLNTLAEEVSRYEKSFFVVRIFQRLFTSIQTKRTLLAYMETRKLLAPLEISKGSISFGFYINFVQQRIEQISYFSPLRSTLQKISNFFVKKSFTRKKVKLRTNNMQHKHINLMINKISDLHEEIMLLLLSLSKQNNYSKVMKLYQEWKQLSIKYMRDLKDPLEIKSFKEHHSLCEQDIVSKLAQYADQLSQKEFKCSSIHVVQDSIVNEPVKTSNHKDNAFSDKNQMPVLRCKSTLYLVQEKNNLSSEIKKQEEVNKEEKLQNAASMDLIFDEAPKTIKEDYELNLLHCFSTALNEMKDFMELVKKNHSWSPQGGIEQKEIAHFRGAFKKLLVCCHPDKNPILLKPLAEDNFKSINEQLVKFNNLLEKNSREIFIEDFQKCLNAIALKKTVEDKNLKIRNQREEEKKQQECKRKRAKQFEVIEGNIDIFSKKINELTEMDKDQSQSEQEDNIEEEQYTDNQIKILTQIYNEKKQQNNELKQFIQQCDKQLEERDKQLDERDQQLDLLKQIFNERNNLINEITQIKSGNSVETNEQAQKIKELDQKINEKNQQIVSLLHQLRRRDFSESQASQISLSGLQGQGLFANLIPASAKTSTGSTKLSSTMSSTGEFSPKSLNVSAHG